MSWFSFFILHQLFSSKYSRPDKLCTIWQDTLESIDWILFFFFAAFYHHICGWKKRVSAGENNNPKKQSKTSLVGRRFKYLFFLVVLLAHGPHKCAKCTNAQIAVPASLIC